jgi:hypothetical protein
LTDVLGPEREHRARKVHIVITITVPIAVAAATKPTRPTSATHSGVKTSPSMLAPLYAVARAAGLARSNHGATIALTAAAPIATQPPPLRIAAAKSCTGVAAMAQPTTPPASVSTPADVTRETPNRRYSAGRFAITIAPTRNELALDIVVKLAAVLVLESKCAQVGE